MSHLDPVSGVVSDRVESETTLQNELLEVWGHPIEWLDVLDCLMTTACTGRELPAGKGLIPLTTDIFSGK